MAEIIDLLGRRQSDLLVEAGFADWPTPQPGTEIGCLWVYDLMPAIDAAFAADERMRAAIARYKEALDRQEAAAALPPSSPEPPMRARPSRGKARIALALERANRRRAQTVATDAVAGLGCRVHSGCIDAARCRAAARCLDLAAVLTPDGPSAPP